MYQVGVDVGGTFTDVVMVNECTGEVTVSKILNYPHRQSEAVVEGIRRSLEESGTTADEIKFIGHGTTITTNAVIERKGATTALITNEGFRDVLEIGRFSRPAELIYDIYRHKPAPLVPRYLRFGLDCRIDKNGTSLKAPDEEDIRDLAESLKREGVSTVAVCFLFSFLNDEHERMVGVELKRHLPELEVMLSSNILPEFREYPRSSTTVFAAYVAPVLRRYIEDLLPTLYKQEVDCPVYIFQSNGGIAQPKVALSNPATTLLSGPAGAVIGATELCKQAGYENFITMDMGGTSLDVCVVSDGEGEKTTSKEVEGFPLSMPTLDIQAVGAGGGSVIKVDDVGRVRVGPESMGADPGPACYGRGGYRPTLTDVNLLLGYLSPSHFAGGDVPLYSDLGHKAVERVAEKLGLSVLETARGVYGVATSQMAEEMRAVVTERGYDVRDFVLVAFGGAGPVHAVAIAGELGIETVVVPQNPGLFSANGIAIADFTHDYVQSMLTAIDEITPQYLRDSFTNLEERGRKELQSEGIESERQHIFKSVDVRYVGQTTEINVPLTTDMEDSKQVLLDIVADFHKRHEQAYTYSVPGEPVEIVNVRVRATGEVSKPGVPEAQISHEAPVPLEHRSVLFPGNAKPLDAPVYRRETLAPGTKLAGPIVVQENSSTNIIPSGVELAVDRHENLVMSLKIERSI